MKPLQTSSGELLADRRADFAEFLFASQDFGEAAELMMSALELAPNWSFGWFRLGEFHEAAGAMDPAAEAWRMALKLDPADRVGAALKLQLAGQEQPGMGSTSGFVETLFDQYASSFDKALVGKLDYHVPELLLDAIRAQAGDTSELAIDLGCGTGLMGERLRPFTRNLEGYDISTEMLRKAAAKKLYDRLQKTDLQTMVYSGLPADLVVAADVFIYLGALASVMHLARSMLRPSGLFAFSVERHGGDEEFVLRSSRRYAHSERHVRTLLEDAGFAVLSLTVEAIRRDRDQTLEGLIIVARATPETAEANLPLPGAGVLL
ncbi:MAG: methyltransferase domain-containing protein [Rhizobiaceae bacterium]|nr:methyltransferase domain-containing protein [Rhizobiaceae bacterium]